MWTVFWATGLRLVASIPIHPLWPLSIFPADSCYANNYQTSFINFLQYNTWGQLDKIDILYHSCGDKIVKYEVEGRTIKFSNSHFFFECCFIELEKQSFDPFIYTPSTSPTLWPKSQEESKGNKGHFGHQRDLTEKYTSICGITWEIEDQRDS